jgi:hypothetical protein
LAYKRVREDYKDIYSGTIDNIIGTVVSVPREQVDPDRRHQCSYGLHVGALDYVRGYGARGHILVVKVNPQDCVSVPQDHNHMKLRTCRYEILFELPLETAEELPYPCYSTDGTAFDNVGDYCEDSEECDCEEEDVSCNVDEDFWTIGWNSTPRKVDPLPTATLAGGVPEMPAVVEPAKSERQLLLEKYRLTEEHADVACHGTCPSDELVEVLVAKPYYNEPGLYYYDEPGLYCGVGGNAALIKSKESLDKEIAKESLIASMSDLQKSYVTPIVPKFKVGDAVVEAGGYLSMEVFEVFGDDVFCSFVDMQGIERRRSFPADKLELVVEEEEEDNWNSSSSCEWQDSGC